MASASLLKVIHSGMQDERLLPPRGQPQMDAFQKVFVKGGRFTTEWYRVDFDNRPAFGTTARATLPRRGHLITHAYLVTTMPDLSVQQTAARKWCVDNNKTFAGPTFGWTNSIGHALINQAQLTIAAEPISTLDGRLMEVLDEFQTPLEKVTTANRLLGRYDNNYTPSKNLGIGPQQYITPLPFWFNRGDPSAALPIDAIGTDPVQIAITFAPVASLYSTTSRTKNAQTGSLTQPPMNASPFYYLTTIQGSDYVAGLNGNPEKTLQVLPIPGITMPSTYELGADTYLLLEYVYLDKAEANQLRVGDLSYPIVQHYAINPFDTKGHAAVSIPFRVPNPARDMYFMCHRPEADLLNAPFLATRDLSGLPIVDPSGVGLVAPWWSDASGLNLDKFLPLVPAYSQTDSEPLLNLALRYEGSVVRYASDAPVFFRSILPTFEQRKTPWHHKYLYHLPFGTQHHQFGITQFAGEANLDKMNQINLDLTFQPKRGTLSASDVPPYVVYIWVETYNILKVYGGRAGLLFKY